METIFSTEEENLMMLLSDALCGERHSLPQEQTDWNRFCRLAEKHVVLSLLYDRLQGEQLPQDAAAHVDRVSRRTVQQSYHLLFLSRYILQVLEKAGIRAALLKGVGTASFYLVPELRKSGDIDILLVDYRKETQADSVLQEAGFTRKEIQLANHHLVYRAPDGIDLELHTLFAEPFDNKKMNRYMEELREEVQNHLAEREIMGCRLLVLSDGYHAFELLLHMLQHFLRAGFGLKLLCDWVVFWNRPVAEEEIRLYVKLVRETGLEGFSSMITTLAADHLGLRGNPEGIREEKDGFYYAGGIFAERMNREESRGFLRDILDAQEFGASGSDRMVLLRGTGLTAYVREFHHQMHLNFPKCGKIWIFWPVLWIATLVKFLKNNRKLHRASAVQIMKTAGKRSQRMEQLQLFQVREQKGK